MNSVVTMPQLLDEPVNVTLVLPLLLLSLTLLLSVLVLIVQAGVVDRSESAARVAAACGAVDAHLRMAARRSTAGTNCVGPSARITP